VSGGYLNGDGKKRPCPQKGVHTLGKGGDGFLELSQSIAS